MNLSGLSILSNLITFIIGKFTLVSIASINDETTIKKSKIFHVSLKYEFLSCTKPKEIILRSASKLNIEVKK